MIVNRRADENDVVLQQPGIDVVSAFAAVRLFDDHRELKLWHAETSRLMFVSLGYHLRAEEPEPEATFHFWLSSRFGNCGRATRLFCRFSTSISSYRAHLALSSERASPLPIRHCRSASAAISFSKSSSDDFDLFCGRDAIEQQFGFHVVDGAVALLPRSDAQSTFTCAWVNALRGQRRTARSSRTSI